MVATGWKGGTYGVRVGRENAARYFNRSWTEIEVLIDGHLSRIRASPHLLGRLPRVSGQGDPAVVSAKEHCALAVSSTSAVGSHFNGREPLFTLALTLLSTQIGLINR
jgi:hypothetical protein